MKQIIITFLIGITLVGKAQVGTPFPELAGKNLEGKNITLPQDNDGKFTLVGMAYSKRAEANLGTWYNPVYNKFVLKSGLFDAEYDINIYLIPMFTGLQKAGFEKSRQKTLEVMDKPFLPYVLFYKGNLKTFKDPLKMDDPNLPYIFLIDPSGKVVYATSGRYIDKKMEDIEDFLNDQK